MSHCLLQAFCSHSHHHTASLLLWGENSEKTQARWSTAFTPFPYPSSIHCFAFASLLLPVAKLVIMSLCQSSIAIFITSPPGDSSVWADFEAYRTIWHKKLHILRTTQLLSSRICMWSETEPGVELLKCIGSYLNILAQLLFAYFFFTVGQPTTVGFFRWSGTWTVIGDDMNASVEEHGLEEHLCPHQILGRNCLPVKWFSSSHFAMLIKI